MKVQTLFKKALAVLIAVMMLASVTVPSFAAEISATDESVTYTDVATVNEFNTAIAAGQNVRLTKSLTFETKFTVEKDVIIDLNSRKLAVKVGGNTFSKDANVVITNGKIEITDCVASGDAIFCIGNYSNNATLTLDNVAIEGTDYSSDYAVFYVYNTSAFNLNACEVELINDVASAGGFIKAEQGKDGIVNITDSSIALEDAKIGILDGTVTIKGSTLTIKGGANAINQSALTVIDSTITVDGADGRALTLSQGDVVVENSTLNFSNCSEGEIRFKKSLSLTLDDTSSLNECSTYVDSSANGATINGVTVNGTKSIKSTVSVAAGEVDLDNPFCATVISGSSTTYYASLQEAIDAAPAGSTVALIDNVDLTAPIVIAADDDIVLELNGNYIKGASDNNTKAFYVIDNNGKLTINDNGNGLIELVNAVISAGYSYATDAIINKGNLIVNGGTIKNNLSGASYAIDNAPGGTTTVNGGKIINTNGTAIRVYGNSTTVSSALNVNDGVIEGKYAVRAQNLNNTAAQMIDITFNGGTINGTNGWAFYSFCNNGTNVNITINNGEFNGYVGFGGGSKVAHENIAISGGTFNGDANDSVFTYDATTPAFISGGVFSSDVSDLIADDLTLVPLSNGTYGVYGADKYDVNGDRYIDIRDTVRLKKIASGMFDQNGDITGDDICTADDIATVRKYILTANTNLVISASPWDGKTVIPPVVLEDTILEINYPSQLAWISEQVAAGNNLNGYTVYVYRDVDLNNKAWTPIGNASNRLAAVFDGNGKTISNLKVEGTDYVGFIGRTQANVKNVVIENAIVTGKHYVAAVAAYMYYANITDCSVVNATITCVDEAGEDGDKAGAITGYITEGNTSVPRTYLVTGNSASNVTITANRDAGYLVGMLQKHVYFADNTYDNCSVAWSGFGTQANLAANYDGMVGRTNNTFVIDEATKSAYIHNQVEMIQFANYVNDGNTMSGYTVYLANDIDLMNINWTPIGSSTTPFSGTFDGQGYSISNLVVNGGSNSNIGLFGMTTNGEIKNFTLENADVSGRLNVGAVAGTPYTSKYSNITITGDVKVEGYAYVGALGGKNAYANITDITIDVTEDSYVKAESENYRTYVGGLVGFMGEGGHTVSNVTSNIDVYGSTIDVGGIVGMAHYGNKFDNVVCTGDVYIESDYNEVGGIAGVWHNENGTTVTMIDCAFTGTIYAGGAEFDCANGGLVNAPYSSTGTGELIIGVTKESGIDHAVLFGGNINVLDDITVSDEIIIENGIDADIALNDNTVSGIINNKGSIEITDGYLNSTGRGLDNFGVATLTDVTMNAGNPANHSIIAYANSLTIFNNFNLVSAGGGINIQDGGKAVFNSGSVAVNSTSTSERYLFYAVGNGSEITINGGDFSFSSTLNQKRAYVYANVGTTVYINGGNFGKASTRSGYTAGILGEGTVIITGGTFKFDPSNWVADGYHAVLDNGVYTVIPENADLIVYDSTELDAAIANGETAIALGSGNFVIPDSAQGKTLTFVGNGNTVIATQDDGSYEGCDYSLDGATVTFENITINTDSTTYTGYARLKATYNNCTINGTYTLYDDSVFNNCTFNVSGDVYNIWTWGATNATFNGCTFNSDGKALLLYGTANTNLTVNNCVFNDNGGLTDLKAAIEIGNDYNKSYTLTVNDTVVNGYEINDKGTYTGTTLFANKNSMTTLKVTVDNTVYVTNEADLMEAFKADKEVIDIVLLNSIDCYLNCGIGTENTKEVNISAVNKNTVLNITCASASYMGSYVTFRTVNPEAVMNFSNITLEKSNWTATTWNTYNIEFYTDVNIDNCIINHPVTFCTKAVVSNTNIMGYRDNASHYAVWVCEGADVTFNGGAIIGTRNIKVDDEYSNSGELTKLTVNNTAFVSTDTKPAILVKVPNAEITVNNASIAGVLADNVDPVWIDEDATIVNVVVTVNGSVLDNAVINEANQ